MFAVSVIALVTEVIALRLFHVADHRCSSTSRRNSTVCVMPAKFGCFPSISDQSLRNRVARQGGFGRKRQEYATMMEKGVAAALLSAILINYIYTAVEYLNKPDLGELYSEYGYNDTVP